MPLLLADAGWAVSYRNHSPWIAPVMCYALINGGQSEFQLHLATIDYSLSGLPYRR